MREYMCNAAIVCADCRFVGGREGVVSRSDDGWGFNGWVHFGDRPLFACF